jgi:transketolase
VGPSIKSILVNEKDFSPDNYLGRNIHFGVREHAMGGILNGMALYGGIFPFGGTYFVFSDYMRPSIRLAALMNLPVIYVFSHDSVLLGTDGPTHQPVEQLASFRAMPNLTVLRPCDANETVAAWQLALENRAGPTLLSLSRHAIPVLEGTVENCYQNVSRGAYLLSSGEKSQPDALVLATGSEVHLAVDAQEILACEGIDIAVISCPSLELFEKQPDEYKFKILPAEVKHRLAVEAGSPQGWWKYVGSHGDVFGVNRFGIPGSTEDVIEYFNLTGAEVAQRVRKLLAN